MWLDILNNMLNFNKSIFTNKSFFFKIMLVKERVFLRKTKLFLKETKFAKKRGLFKLLNLRKPLRLNKIFISITRLMYVSSTHNNFLSITNNKIFRRRRKKRKMRSFYKLFWFKNKLRQNMVGKKNTFFNFLTKKKSVTYLKRVVFFNFLNKNTYNWLHVI